MQVLLALWVSGQVMGTGVDAGALHVLPRVFVANVMQHTPPHALLIQFQVMKIKNKAGFEESANDSHLHL
jgi:hypothetical protein